MAHPGKRINICHKKPRLSCPALPSVPQGTAGSVCESVLGHLKLDTVQTFHKLCVSV